MPRRPSPNAKSASYLLRLTPDEKARLEMLAEQTGTTLAEALREGADHWLRRRAVKAVPAVPAERGSRAVVT